MSIEPPTGDCPDHHRLLLTADRPREHLADDRLGYARFAQSLARAISELAPREGIVLAVNGPWGSGKTTAVNMIVEVLDTIQQGLQNKGKILPIRFNPWWFSEQENLVKAFFAEVSGSLERKLSEKIGDGFRKIAHRIASSKDLVVAGLALVPGGALLKDPAGAAMGALGGLAKGDKSLSELREELAADLRTQDQRLLIIIDDVDRLPADEIRQIFRLIKSPFQNSCTTRVRGFMRGDGLSSDIGFAVGDHRTAVSTGAGAATGWTSTGPSPSGADGHSLCAALRHSMGHAAHGAWLRFRRHVLAAIA